MKKITNLLFAAIICLNGFSQPAKFKLPGDIELIKISGDAYIHVSYTNLPQYGRIGANGLLLTDKNEAFLFDSPWTDTQTRQLLTWLNDSLRVAITGFVPNHWHGDCMGGLGYLKKQHIPSYANQTTIDIARKEGLPVPENGFKDSLELHLSSKLIKCYYLGAAHSIDNIVVWIPSEKILFAGCMVKSMDSKNLGNTADGDLKAYPVTIGRLMEKFQDAKMVIPGHGQAGGFELIRHTLELSAK